MHNHLQSQRKNIHPITERRDEHSEGHMEKLNDKENESEEEIKEVIRLGRYENGWARTMRLTLLSQAVTQELFARTHLLKGEEK